jgi:hypothetical protein
VVGARWCLDVEGAVGLAGDGDPRHAVTLASRRSMDSRRRSSYVMLRPKIPYWCADGGKIVLLTVVQKTRQHDQRQNPHAASSDQPGCSRFETATVTHRDVPSGQRAKIRLNGELATLLPVAESAPYRAICLRSATWAGVECEPR